MYNLQYKSYIEFVWTEYKNSPQFNMKDFSVWYHQLEDDLSEAWNNLTVGTILSKNNL